MNKQRRRKAILAVILSIAMSTQAFAAVNWNWEDGDLHIVQNDSRGTDYTVSGNSNGNVIIVDDGATANITMTNTTINATGESGIDIGSGADVTLELVGDNTVSSNDSAAVHVSDSDLTIADKAGDTGIGTLTAQGGKHDAAIGTNANENLTGSINITGGSITATGVNDGAAIGTGKYGNIEESGAINISGGDITAQGGKDAAAIGTGLKGHLSMTGSINISGGDITATGGEDGAAIGTGDSGIITGNASINISGGTILAQGGDDAAGIGTGVISTSHAEDPANNEQSDGSWVLTRGTMQGYGSINISGGTVTANGGKDGAGIGTGSSSSYYSTNMSDASSINISGGTVTANGGNNAAGIGTGKYSEMQHTSSINISGGTVTANGGSSAAGVGTGTMLGSSSINVSGGDVTANGGTDGAGIGTGGFCSITASGSINVSGGNVTANGGSNAAGIGTGYVGDLRDGASINVSGGTVTANGGSNGAGIGTGMEGYLMNETSISITGNSDVTAEAGADYLKPIGIGSYGYIISTYTKEINYTIGSEATINGNKITTEEEAADVFATDDDTAFNFVDEFIPVPTSSSAAPQYIIWNADHDVSAVVTTTAVKSLIEKELTEEESALLLGEEEALYTAHLTFDKEYNGTFHLRFHIGTEYAGQTVEIRKLNDDGSVSIKTVKVGTMGTAVLMNATLGSYAIVLAA